MGSAFLPRRCECQLVSIPKINNTGLTRVKRLLIDKLKCSAKETVQIEENY